MVKSKISFWHPVSLICTCFGVGKIPFAPGTWGSLVGLICAFFLPMSAYVATTRDCRAQGDPIPEPQICDTYVFLIPIILIIVVSYLFAKVIDYYQKRTMAHDSKQVVIDKFVGQMITVYVAYFIVAYFDQDFSYLPYFYDPDFIASILPPVYITLATLFVIFRFFDIVKPWPIGWIDKNVKGGLGVMLAGAVAGIFAGVTAVLIFYVFSPSPFVL